MVKKRKSKLFLIIGISLVVIIIFIGIYIKIKPNSAVSGKVVSGNEANSNSQQIQLNLQTLPILLNQQQIVKDLPSNAVVELDLYNFYTGERQIELTYVIKKGEVSIGKADKPDMIIMLHSKYVPDLINFCSGLQKAKANDDLGYDTKISDLAFMFKYSGMMKYRSCLN